MPTPPAAAPSPSLLARIGRGSPLYVLAIYAVCQLLSLLMLGVAQRNSNRALMATGGLVWPVGIALAFTIVTWFREDDTVAAGFLFGFSIGGGNLGAMLLLMIIKDRALGGAILGFMTLLIPAGIATAIAIAAGMALISLGRFLHPGVAKPVPPPRKFS